MKKFFYLCFVLIFFLATVFIGCGGGSTSSNDGGGPTSPNPNGGDGSTPPNDGGNPPILPWTGVKQLGSSSVDQAYGVAVDGSSNVYVTGYTEGGLDGNTSAGGYDLFLVKYDSAGVKQ